jgi:hypothetical protein
MFFSGSPYDPTNVAITGGTVRLTPSGAGTPSLRTHPTGAAGLYGSSESVGLTANGVRGLLVGVDGLIVCDQLTNANITARYLSDGGNNYTSSQVLYARAQCNSAVRAENVAGGIEDSIYKKRAAAINVFTTLLNADGIYLRRYAGDNGTARKVGAAERVTVVGSPTANVVPMRYDIEIADAAGVLQKALCMQPDGTVTVGTSATDGVNRLQVNGHVAVAATFGYKVAATQVVGARRTGWSTWTGTASRASRATYAGETANALYTPSQLQVLMDHVRDNTQAFKALLDDLHANTGHGLVGLDRKSVV